MAFSMGISVSEFKHLTPKKLMCCAKGYKIRQKWRDEEMWRMGVYVQFAVSTAVEHNLAGRKAKSKYIEKPLLESVEAENKELTEDVIKQKRRLFIEKMKTMKTNFDVANKEKIWAET